MFFLHNLDDQNHVELAGKIRFLRAAGLAVFLEARPCDPGPKRSLICPVGQSALSSWKGIRLHLIVGCSESTDLKRGVLPRRDHRRWRRYGR